MNFLKISNKKPFLIKTVAFQRISLRNYYQRTKDIQNKIFGLKMSIYISLNFLSI